MESPETDGTTYGHLEYDNGGSWDHWAKDEFFIS